MQRYKNIFKNVLVERTDKEVWQGSFETPDVAGDFGVDPAANEAQIKQIQTAKNWIKRLESFANWINGTEIDSLNKQFITLDKEGSTFEGISNHSKRLISIAEDLASLEETIKGYILTADKKEQENISNQDG
jgi:hypothetical protein